MQTSAKLIAALICAISTSLFCYADTSGEREALTRVVHELDIIETLIDKAKAQSNTDERIQFRYDWLKQDLSKVRSGIQHHISSPRTYPRIYPPLRGDYSR